MQRTPCVWVLSRNGGRVRRQEATGGFEPPNEGFADPCLTTWRRRRLADSRWQIASGSCHKPSAICHLLESGRWDSNPRPSPWQGDVLPQNHARRLAVHLAEVPRPRIELGTPAFSVQCSTN